MSRDLLFRLFLLLVLLLAFGLRVYHVDSQSIWWDEGHSIEMSSAPLTAIATLPGMDVHPPVYFMVLHLWMGLAGTAEFALRYLSVVFGMLAVALLMRFAREIHASDGDLTPTPSPPSPLHLVERGKGLGDEARRGAGPFPTRGLRRVQNHGLWAGLVCGMLVALLPAYVAHAQEVRMYAMLTCLAVLSGYAQWRVLFRHGAPERRAECGPERQLWNGTIAWWIVYVLAATAALYTHYFTIFLLLFQNGAWLIWVAARRDGRTRRLALWFGSLLAILALFAPQLPLALRQTTAYANPNLQPPSLGEFLSRTWLAYTVGPAVPPSLLWLATAAALVTMAVLGLWVWRVWRERSYRRSLAMLLYLLGWLCIPLALYFAVVQRRPSFEPRYMIEATPALLLLWAGAVAAPDCPGLSAGTGKSGPSRWGRSLGLVAALALVAVLAAGTYGYFANSAAFKDDAAGVARWLAAETTPEDLVYVDVPHPFHYYADRIPAPTRYLFVDIHTAADTLNLEAAGRRRVYWVTWYGSDTDPRGVIPYLLDKAARRGGERDFRGYHVAWWEIPANVRFSLPEDLAPVDVAFGPSIRVDGAAYGDVCHAGGSTWVTLHFALLGETGVDYRASLRLRDAQGNMLPPTDKDILNDRHLRTSDWPVDDAHLNQAVNVYALPVPSSSAPGDYRLELVVYDAATSTALPVTGVSSPDGISALLGMVKVQP